MHACEHEFENANCINCANGLPASADECKKTRGLLEGKPEDKSLAELLNIGGNKE